MAAARYRPAGLQLTGPAGRPRLRTRLRPLSTSQTRTAPSLAADSRDWQSGLHEMLPEWVVRITQDCHESAILFPNPDRPVLAGGGEPTREAPGHAGDTMLMAEQQATQTETLPLDLHQANAAGLVGAGQRFAVGAPGHPGQVMASTDRFQLAASPPWQSPGPQEQPGKIIRPGWACAGAGGRSTRVCCSVGSSVCCSVGSSCARRPRHPHQTPPVARLSPPNRIARRW